jgi:prepilin-type N-terminal cleavage/methylation domain-containing protein
MSIDKLNKKIKVSLYVRAFRIIMALTVILVFLAISMLVWRYYQFYLSNQSTWKNMDFLTFMYPIIILVAICLLPIYVFVANYFCNDRIVNISITVLLVIIIYAGLLDLQEPSRVGLYIGIVLAIYLSLFFAFYKMPLMIFTLFTMILLLGFCWQLLPPIITMMVLDIKPSQLFMPFLFAFIMLSVGGMLMACAYLPRGIEWKRYLFPYRNNSVFSIRKKEDGGFTLIEVLISVAILGILSGGVFHSWASIVRSHKQLQIRSHALEIINSEMNALMAADTALVQSEKPNALPINLQDFVSPYTFTGDYIINKTDDAGIVKITVKLSHIIENRSERNFRLVGYRRLEVKAP